MACLNNFKMSCLISIHELVLIIKMFEQLQNVMFNGKGLKHFMNNITLATIQILERN